MPGTDSQISVRVSVEFILIKIPAPYTPTQMSGRLLFVKDVVEALLLNTSRPMSTIVLTQRLDDLLCLPGESITIPFMYPNTLNEEVRRVLWPRCLRMMLDIGFEYVDEESELRRAEQASLEEDSSLQRVELATKSMCKEIPRLLYSKVAKELNSSQCGESKGKKRKREKEKCVVCLSSFRKNSKVKKLPGCGHVFHARCIDKCLRRTAIKCPVCRAPVVLTKEITG